MRHKKKGRKMGTGASHRKLILGTMAAQLIEHERIQTTEAKAKELRTVIDGMITLAKRGDISARRKVLGNIKDRALTHKLFTEIAEKYAERAGGYTRIAKIGPRPGDGAPVVIIELV